MAMVVTNSLPNCRLVNLIDVTLACEDANSKLVEVVTVANVPRFLSWSLVTIVPLMFCRGYEIEPESRF